MGTLRDMALALGCDLESTVVPPEERRAIAVALAAPEPAEPMPAYMLLHRRTQAIRMHKELVTSLRHIEIVSGPPGYGPVAVTRDESGKVIRVAAA